MKSKVVYSIAAIFFILSIGVSYFIFSHSTKQAVVQQLPITQKLTNGLLQFDQSLPKTESCPLNGVKYSTQQRTWWETHRPLGVMIENHEDARPQSGLSFADTVYEAVAEGGITRFLAVFYCQDASTVGPVRSARSYFVDWISEYADFPLYAHVGGANAAGPADALGQIESYGWNGYNDLNQFYLGFPTYWRDYDRLGHTVATEHTMYSATSKLWQAGVDHSLTNVDKNGNSWDKKFVSYTFKDEAPTNARPRAQTIHVEFWQGYSAYFVDWKYDPKNNVYLRFNGGKPHIDLDTKKQLTAKNIIVLSMGQQHAVDGYENNEHLLFADIGSGKATIFIDGKETVGIWKKTSRTARTRVFDSAGNEISFDRGNIWFTILPLDGVLNVQ